ncbi:IS630 family transposase domain protein [Candidatus Cyrtobacter comes]|uniref:IS630 family transposase domain protein n=1 Tax=Candidatus Cyrtobacter comes TaxID=675776 RepID=A0ABU5L758_9RICK|nr:hypothetical protein [Candidatus Cyrtobacter comes]MDZ5761967.1 IS630 family transposase domain protein [Candidatus Cyrtobacter comes]MDZ5762075.1 IS630 family transposase domain protein [Candidatus Cyrtobacter comes]
MLPSINLGKDLIESVGFLPPYSHDLKPIEKFLAKRWIRAHISHLAML